MKNIFLLKIFKKREERGVSLYMTIILMAVLMSMVLGVTAIIINGLNIAKGVTDSVKAFHVADTGIENALYRIRAEGLDDSPCFLVDCPPWPSIDLDWKYTFTEYACSTTVPYVSIKSRGTYHGSQRMIEVKYGTPP